MKSLLSTHNKNVFTLLVLLVAVISVALSIVYSKHLNRKYFSELQKLEKQRDEMNIEWGQLQLERSTFASSSEIERAAREKLGMKRPPVNEITMVSP